MKGAAPVKGTRVVLCGTRGKCRVRTVIGELDGYVYMRIGGNPRSAEGVPVEIFMERYEKEAGE